MKNVGKIMFCHRVMYGGLAGTYVAGFAEWLDKPLVLAIAAGWYVALMIKG